MGHAANARPERESRRNTAPGTAIRKNSPSNAPDLRFRASPDAQVRTASTGEISRLRLRLVYDPADFAA
jgi:hypothetical protein